MASEYRSFTLASVIVSVASTALIAFSRVSDVASRAFRAFIDLVCYACPPAHHDLAPVAAAPRIAGLPQTRSYRHRRLEHIGDGRRRAPLSSAFAAAA